MKKRILSFLLAAVMLVGTLFTTAGAAAETGYPDVPSDRWSAEDIAYVSEKGIMQGTDKGFEPAKDVNRAMVVTVLYRLAGEPEINTKSRFTDVADAEAWYYDAVVWGAKFQIVTGFSDKTFRPNDPVTREQLVTFIGRYAQMCDIAMIGADLDGFTDSDSIQSYAVEYFKWAVKIGLVKGVTEDEIRPASGASREQFAAIMHRYDTCDSFDYELKYNEPMPISQYTEKEYPLVEDADFYVAVDGDDNNPGTKEAPFKTFEKAKEAVREFKATATEEIVVAFMAGNYGYLDNISFTAEDSGTAEVPIKYCAYGDGDVIFNNGVHIANERFVPIDESEYDLFEEKNIGNIQKAYIGDLIDKIGQFDVLFSGSDLCWEARTPNKNPNGTDNRYYDMTTRVDQFKSIELQMRAKKEADKFRTVEGMKVTGLLRTGWLYDTFLVESYDKETGVLSFDFDNPDFYSWKFWPMTPWTEEEIANGTAYEFSQYNYDQGDRGAWVLMYEDRYDDNIFFHNIPQLLDDDGEYWIDTKTMTLYVYNANGDYTIANGGKMMSVHANYVSFVGLEFRGSASDHAIGLGATNVTFDLCEFRDMNPLTVILGGGANTAVTNCEFEKFGRRALYIDIEKVYNNYFHNYGWNDPYYVAVSVNVGSVTSHNLFEDGAGGGIIFGGDAIIEYNVFDNLMVNNSDQGLVYTGTNGYRGAEIRYNLFKNVEQGAKYSVYLDDMTCGVRVYGNIFYHANQSVVMNGGRDNEVYDNVEINSAGFTSGAKLYAYYEENRIEDFKPGDRWYNVVMNPIPREGDPRYAEWQEKWPWALNYTTDVSKINEPECVFYNKNYVGRNHLIECYHKLDVPNIIYDNNEIYMGDENRLFVNPTIGDYRIRDDADFTDIHFEMMGRE